MKKSLLFILLLIGMTSQCMLSAQSTKNQKYVVKWSMPEKLKVGLGSFAGRDEKGNYYYYSTMYKMKILIPLLVFNFAKYKASTYLKVYDKKMNFVEDIKIDTKTIDGRKSGLFDGDATMYNTIGYTRNNYRLGSQSLFKWGGKFIATGTGSYKGRTWYAMDMDVTTGELSNQKELIKLPELDENGKKFRSNDLYLSKDFSVDSNYLAFWTTYEKRNSDYTSATVSLFKKGMVPFWTKEIEFPIDKKDLSLEDIRIDREGNFIVLAKQINHKEKSEQPRSVLYKINGSSNGPLKQSYIDFGDDYVENMKIVYNLTGDPLVFGFYRDDRKKGGWDGVYYAHLDENLKAISVQKNPFDKDFLTSAHTTQQAKKIEKKIEKGKEVDEENYYMREAHPTSDSGYIAFAEKYYTTETTSTSTIRSAGGTTMISKTITLHHYEDIMAVKFNSEGVVQWMKKIDKNNVYKGGGPAFKDFTSYDLNGNIYLYFKDEAGKESDAAIVKVLSDGTWSKDRIITTEGLGDFRCKTHSAQLVTTNTLQFYAHKGRKNVMLGTLELEKVKKSK